jgi:hypothetical protein
MIAADLVRFAVIASVPVAALFDVLTYWQLSAVAVVQMAARMATGLIMITASEFLLVFFGGMFGPTFATYRMNATEDTHLSRFVMAWSITNEIVQPVFIATAGAQAAATSAKIALWSWPPSCSPE